MPIGTDDAPQEDKHSGEAGREHQYGGGLSVTGWPLLHGNPGVPPWMKAQLDRLQTAFPAFSFSVRPGWRGLMFEAWRDPGEGGLYAVITGDVSELWRELEGAKSERAKGMTTRPPKQ